MVGEHDNRLFLLGFCIVACTAEPGESGTSPFTATSPDDDDEGTTSGDTTPSPTASAGSSATAASTSSTTDDTNGSSGAGSESTMGVDPTIPTSGVTETTMSSETTSGGSEGSSGGTTGSASDTTGGETTDTGGPSGDYECAPYGNAYALCFYPDDLETGYVTGIYFCQYYAGNCYGISDECDALFEEWLACVTALDCRDYPFPPCPTELGTLQTTCMCGAG